MAKTNMNTQTTQQTAETKTTTTGNKRRNVVIAALVVIILLLGFGAGVKSLYESAYNKGVKAGMEMMPACPTELVDIEDVEPEVTPTPKPVVVVDTATKTHEHVYDLVDFKAPTYSEDGYEKYQCSCGDGWTNSLPKLVAEEPEVTPTPVPTPEPTPTPTPEPACRIELQPVEKQVEKQVEKEIVVEVPTVVEKEIQVETTYYEYDVINEDGSFTHVAATTEIPPQNATNVAFLTITETQIVEETVMVEEVQTVIETVVETVVEYVEVEVCE